MKYMGYCELHDHLFPCSECYPAAVSNQTPIPLGGQLTGSVGLVFVPDAAHINALPEPLRRYIHDLESTCDPAGDMQRIAFLKDQCGGLQVKLRDAEHTAGEAGCLVEDLKAKLAESELTAEALDCKVKTLALHTCACSVDTPTDICGHHSPQVTDLQAKLKIAEDALDNIIEQGDAQGAPRAIAEEALAQIRGEK